MYNGLLHDFNVVTNHLLSPDYYGPLIPEKIKEDLKLGNFQSVEILIANFLNNLLAYSMTHHSTLFEEAEKYRENLAKGFPLINPYGMENYIFWNPSIYYTDYFEKNVKKYCQLNNMLLAEIDAFTCLYYVLSKLDPDSKISRIMVFFYNFQGNPFKVDWKPMIASIDVFRHKDTIFNQSKEELTQLFKNDLPARQDGHPLPILRYYGADTEPVIIE